MILSIFFIISLGSITGKVYDAKTLKHIPFAHISVLGTPHLSLASGTSYGCVTDTLGKFLLKIPEGKYELKVTYVGYEDKILTINISDNKETELNIPLEEKAISLEEVKVSGKRVSDPSFKMLKAEELKYIPFAEIDFFRVIQSLPGVTFISDLIGWLYVRGGLPQENLYLMDGGEVLCPNHYFGVVSAFNVNLLKDVEFSPGGFAPMYGDRLSGVLDVKTRDGSCENVKADIEADLLEVGVESEFPITSKCSYIFSVRKNYFRTIAPLVGIEEGVVLPDYQNLQNKLSFSIDKNHKLSFSNLVLQDEAEASLLNEMNERDEKYKWNNVGNTYVLNYYTNSPNNTMRTIIYHSYLNSEALWATFGTYNRKTCIRKTGVNQRGEFTFKKQFPVDWGLSFSHIDCFVDNDYPLEFIPLVTFDQPILQLYADTATLQYGTYFSMRVPVTEKFVATFGSRMDYLFLNKEMTVSPRLRFSYNLDPKTSVFWSWGHYYQSPNFEFLEFNHNLKSAYANHFVLGMEKAFAESWNGKQARLIIEVYEKRINNLAFIDVEKSIADNSGYGFSRGIEFFLKESFTNNFFGWVSCSFSKSRRTGVFDEMLTDFDADQPVSLNLIGVYSFKRNYIISTTYRHTSGTPYTPIGGYVWSENEWIAVAGPRNSERYPSYNRLDIKFEKGFHMLNSSGSLYFTILNVLQNRNVQVYVYEEDSRRPIYMLPRLIFLGVKFAVL